MSPAAISCREVSVHYGRVKAVDGVDLVVDDGETLALLGPSGSGKTTLLYAIAGFVPVTGGEIHIGGRLVSSPKGAVAPEDRSVGMVFQNYALWPHLNALDTVAFPLRRAEFAKEEARVLAAGLLEKVGIGDLGKRRPAEMSGGQQQRVGLARALARNAAAYLFDEPTAHLDASLRQSVVEEMARRRQEKQAAAVYSTHDAAEAMAVADRVAILKDGRVLQVGTPTEVYERPADLWAARLTGPASQLEAGFDGQHLIIDGVTVPMEGESGYGQVKVIVRPDWIEYGGDLRGVVEEIWYRGPHTDYRVATAAGQLEVRLPGRPRLQAGAKSGWTVQRAYLPPTSTVDQPGGSPHP